MIVTQRTSRKGDATVTLLANAKLTLSFRVLGRRDDGYHTIKGEVVTIDFADELVFEPGTGLQIVDEVVGGLGLRGIAADDSNLVNKAIQMVGTDVAVRLLKRIPSGAGLGGGSADAAAVLRWAGYSSHKAAARLGADVPFCLSGGRARVSGMGEDVTQMPFEEKWFVLMIPPFGIETAQVYENWDRLPESLQHGHTGDGEYFNDLESAALRLEPQLELWRDVFGNATGCQPHMAGSGSSWFVEGTKEQLGLDDRDALVMKSSRAPIVETCTIPSRAL
ncbi:MAG: 4-(cytidine 5'-diphospho)-2-C-methyl-D-erythritol kinase [Acidimicrobiales bacterium]